MPSSAASPLLRTVTHFETPPFGSTVNWTPTVPRYRPRRLSALVGPPLIKRAGLLDDFAAARGALGAPLATGEPALARDEAAATCCAVGERMMVLDSAPVAGAGTELSAREVAEGSAALLQRPLRPALVLARRRLLVPLW
jgi:hypothetical protein